MKTYYAHSRAQFTFTLFAILMLVACGVPARVLAVGESTYSIDTQISVNGVSLTILAGSTASSVTYGATSMTAVAGTGNSLTVQASETTTILNNDAGLPVCSRPDAQLTVTSGTVVITPSATGCPLPVAPVPPSRGANIILGCKDPLASNYNASSFVIAANAECVYKTQNSASSSAPAPLTTAFHFAKNLKQGMNDPSVADLEQFLDTHGAPVALSGWGSLNKLSTAFGSKTTRALKIYQASVGLPATGYFGALTRAYINTLAR